MTRLISALAACAILAVIGMAAQTVPATASAANASMTAQLVEEASRAPVAGVEVKMYTLHGGYVLARAVSDQRGYFTLDGLQGGEYRLDFKKPGYHDTTLVGVYVPPHQAYRMAAAIAMYPMSMKVPRFTATNPCGKLVDPMQVADVYVVCSEK